LQEKDLAMDTSDIIDRIAGELRDEPDIHALFLSGSHGNGLADAYSDIDFVMVSSEGASDAMASTWRAAVETTGEIVLWWDRNIRPALINAIMADWTRIDVIILKPDQMGSQTRDALKPVFDPNRIHDTLRQGAGTQPMPTHRMTYQFEEFIRILGLLPLAVGRGEYINGVLGLFHLVELLIEETAAPHRGGALHLNRLITEDQKDLMLTLPPPVPKKAPMLAAHLAYAKAYLPRARALAAKRGIDWPERFEEVMWARLEETLGVARPYDPASL
jgi:hypothetical protein